jgi:glycosidase
VPNSWIKFRDIAFISFKGVDGFRYDMAEMVPVGLGIYELCYQMKK